MPNHLLDLHSSNPYGQNGEMAEEFGWLVKNIWLGGYKSMSPRDLKVGGWDYSRCGVCKNDSVLLQMLIQGKLFLPVLGMAHLVNSTCTDLDITVHMLFPFPQSTTDLQNAEIMSRTICVCRGFVQ